MAGSAKKTVTAESSSPTTREIVEGATRMSGFNFATWRSASDDPVMRSTMIGLMLLEKAPDWKLLRERCDRASRTNTILRKKVIDSPIAVGNPRLVIDPDFDLSFHLRRFDMPAGATWDDVLEDARRHSMVGFDLDRPLWRMTVLNGLPGGRSVMMLKLHHAIADGQGAVLLGASLFDFSPEGQDLGPMPPEPSGDELSTVGFVEAIGKDAVWRTARTAQDVITGFTPKTLKALRRPRKAAANLVKSARSVARVAAIPLGPLSPLMRKRSINYHFGTFDVPFADIQAVAHASDHTANDVFLAAVSEGMARFHNAEGRPVDKLRINMPISLRKAGDSFENAITIARFEMPIATDGTKKLMDEVAATVQRWRKEPALAWTEQLADVSRILPVELLAAVAQASDVTASNVPGVPIPVWLAGAQILRMYPLVATIGAAVNITMLTYNGTASVGVSSDDAAVADHDLLIKSFREGFAEAIGKPVSARSPLGEGSDEPPVRTKRKGSVRKVSSRKLAPAKKAPAKKAPAKKAASKRAPAKKAPAKKA